jgi:hypothetical protein
VVADPDTAEGKNDPQRRNTQTFVDKKIRAGNRMARGFS